MNFAWLANVSLWSSFGVTVVGVIVSVMLARLARGGALFPFTLTLTAGIVVFALHHLAELLSMPNLVISEGLEAVSSLIFLAATIYLGYRLRKIIYGP